MILVQANLLRFSIHSVCMTLIGLAIKDQAPTWIVIYLRISGLIIYPTQTTLLAEMCDDVI